MAVKIPDVITFNCPYGERKQYEVRYCETALSIDTRDADEHVVVCPRCKSAYEVWVRQNRHSRSRKHKRAYGDEQVRTHNMRVYRLDEREELISFEDRNPDLQPDIKSGDVILLVFGANRGRTLYSPPR